MQPGAAGTPPPPAQPRYLQLLGGEGGAGPLGRLRLAVLLRGHGPLQRDPVACGEKPRVLQSVLGQLNNSRVPPSTRTASSLPCSGDIAARGSGTNPELHGAAEPLCHRVVMLPLKSLLLSLEKTAVLWKSWGMRDGERTEGWGKKGWGWTSGCVKEGTDVLGSWHHWAALPCEQLRRGPCVLLSSCCAPWPRLHCSTASITHPIHSECISMGSSLFPRPPSGLHGSPR